MLAASSSNRTRGSATSSPERRCGLTRVRAPQGQLLRLVLDPDGRIVFDIRGRAGGRGAYVSPDRDTVRRALSPNGARRLLGPHAQAPSPQAVEPILDATANRLADRVAEHIHFARRAGAVVWGVAEVVAAASELGLVVIAEDLSPRSAHMLSALDPDRVVRKVMGSKASLGEILGKGEVGAIGVRPSVFVERILWDGERYQRLTNQARRPEGPAEPAE